MYSVDVFAVVPLLSGPARRTGALSVHSESPGWGHTGFPSPKHGEIQLALHAALPLALLLHLQPRRVSNLHQRVTSLAGFSAASDERLLMASCPVLSCPQLSGPRLHVCVLEGTVSASSPDRAGMERAEDAGSGSRGRRRDRSDGPSLSRGVCYRNLHANEVASPEKELQVHTSPRNEGCTE